MNHTHIGELSGKTVGLQYFQSGGINLLCPLQLEVNGAQIAQ